MKISTNTTLYFNCIIQQDLCQHRPSAHITTRRSYMSIEEAWGEFRACSRARKRSPRLVENGHGVRRSAQLREPRTLQCFCQVASAHLLRSWGDEAVDEYGRTSRRRRLSQGRDLRWLNSSSNALYELGTWHNNAMAANGYSMKTVWPETTGCRVRGEVSSSDSLRVNGAGDSSGLPRGRHHLGLTPHRVLWVPKSPENLHDAITVDYSKESRSKCWQGWYLVTWSLVDGPVEREKGGN